MRERDVITLLLDELARRGLLVVTEPASGRKERSWQKESMDRINTAPDAGGSSVSGPTGAQLVALMRAKKKPSGPQMKPARRSGTGRSGPR